jgi:hypothetical protein
MSRDDSKGPPTISARRKRQLASLALLPLMAAGVRDAARAASEVPLRAIGRDQLCVTNGAISSLPDGRLAIETPSSRAVLRASTGQVAEIRFRYLGPTLDSKPLASGEMRRQIGLKLRAQDSCNLVYAMWHIEPDSKFGVSIKRNIGKSTHEQCHADGYTTIKPGQSVTLPRIRVGEPHVLRAALEDSKLTLTADGKTVWEGELGKRIAEFDGPVGLRTDNARFELEYLASPGQAPSPYALQCRQGPGD